MSIVLFFIIFLVAWWKRQNTYFLRSRERTILGPIVFGLALPTIKRSSRSSFTTLKMSAHPEGR